MSSSSIYLKRFREYLELGNYSDHTITMYLKSIESFFSFCKSNKELDVCYQEFARRYMLKVKSCGHSWSTINIHYSSMKLFSEKVRGEEWNIAHLPRPKGEKNLQRILSKEEIARLIGAPRNLKHKAIIALMYGTGMRVSEVINLKLSDIDSDRLELFVERGKGSKDRIIRLPQTLLKLLRVYCIKHRPVQYLIEGRVVGQPYTQSSVGKVIKRSAKIAKISKAVSPHTLRHSYATHHLENGTDLLYLKEQLGHSNIKTTLKYLHLCKERVRLLNHPIDQIKLDFLSGII